MATSQYTSAASGTRGHGAAAEPCTAREPRSSGYSPGSSQEPTPGQKHTSNRAPSDQNTMVYYIMAHHSMVRYI